MRYILLARVSFLTLGASLALASLAGAGFAATSPSAIPTMIPLLGLQRKTSFDEGFITRAVALAISQMTASNREISLANTVAVQDEAVRAFNSAATAYNGLADIASKRAMAVAKPKASTLDDAPALAQDAVAGPQDDAFVVASRASLESAVSLYNDEIQHGTDPQAVAFATQMRSRFIHDLELVAIDMENIDHPKSLATALPASPDPSPSV